MTMRWRLELLEQANADPVAAQETYARSDLFDRRRTLMDAWERFATGRTEDVVQMVGS